MASVAVFQASVSGPRARGTRASALLGTLLLLLSGCGEIRPGPPQTGGPAPSYAGATLTGETLSLEELRGQPILLNLWATWCGPCRTETPFLQSVYEEYGSRGLRVIGVTVDGAGSVASIESFLEEFGVTYDIVHDPGMKAMDAFSALGLPATYLIDREGRIRFVRLGPVDENDHAFLSLLEEMVS